MCVRDISTHISAEYLNLGVFPLLWRENLSIHSVWYLLPDKEMPTYPVTLADGRDVKFPAVVRPLNNRA